MESIVVALCIGALFFAPGAILTVLAVKYGPNSPIWAYIIWGCVSFWIMGVATLILFYSSKTFGKPFGVPALLINLGICAVTAGFVWHFSSGSTATAPTATSASPTVPEFHLDMLGTSVFDAIRPLGSEKNTGIGIWAKVWNTGAPSVVTSWTLTVIPSNGHSDFAQMIPTPDSFPLNGPNPMVLRKSNSIDFLTSQEALGEIPKEGTILFLTNIEREVVLNNTTMLILTIKDNREKEYTIAKQQGEFGR